MYTLLQIYRAYVKMNSTNARSQLDARVYHYTHSGVWIMRDGRLIIILIVTYNIRCVGAISFTLCTRYTQIYFLGSIIFHARGVICTWLNSFARFYIHARKIGCVTYLFRNFAALTRNFHNEEFCFVDKILNDVYLLFRNGARICKSCASTRTIHHWPKVHV